MGIARLRVPSIRGVLISAVLIFACGNLARAQYAAGAPPAHISFVEGTAWVAHDGTWETAVINLPLVEGDRIRTIAGRVQVWFPDGTAIDLDPYSEIVFVTDTRIRVSVGSIERQEVDDRDDASAPYLPQELQMYGGTFGHYGSWQNEAAYGAVWYPRVASTWRPYYHGYWAPVPSYGWTWVGFDPWDWPTHHYGRWGYAHGSWFWVPGRTWAPAWVSWASAPGYVSWCPLGMNGYSVFALSIGHGDPWRGWTVVSRDTFGGRDYAVQRYAVEPHNLTRATPFIIQSRAPVALSAAMPRPAPLGAAGVAVPRDRSGPGRAFTAPPSVRGATPAEGPSRAVDGRAAAVTPRAVPRYGPPPAAPRDDQAPGRVPGEAPGYAAPRAVPRYGLPPAAPRNDQAPGRVPGEAPGYAAPRAVPRYGLPPAAQRDDHAPGRAPGREPGERPVYTGPSAVPRYASPSAAPPHVEGARSAPPPPPPAATERGGGGHAPSAPVAAPRSAPPSAPARERPAPQRQ
jgi:hypothetical protein